MLSGLSFNLPFLDFANVEKYVYGHKFNTTHNELRFLYTKKISLPRVPFNFSVNVISTQLKA